MAKLPIFRRIRREDIPEAPEWIDFFIVSINQFFETTYNAFNKSLTFTENMDAQINEFSLVGGAAATNNIYRFPISTKSRPRNLVITRINRADGSYTPLSSAPWVDWHLDGTDVVVDSIIGLTNGIRYNITLLLF